MRLIDADAMEECIRKRYCEDCKVNKRDYDGVRCRACAAGDMLDDIEDMPTVDPDKHSRWQFVETAMRHEDAVMCKNCFKVYVQKSNVNCPTWRYCPNCGAKMDEEITDATD